MFTSYVAFHFMSSAAPSLQNCIRLLLPRCLHLARCTLSPRSVINLLLPNASCGCQTNVMIATVAAAVVVIVSAHSSAHFAPQEGEREREDEI